MTISPDELAFLESLSGMVRYILVHPEESPEVVDRLFPPAHADENDEAEHRRLVGDMLWERRRESLALFDDSLAQAEMGENGLELELDEPVVDLWLHVTNDVRVILGTQLGIMENGWTDRPMDDPADEERRQVMIALGAVQEGLIQAMSRNSEEDSPD